MTAATIMAGMVMFRTTLDSRWSVSLLKYPRRWARKPTAMANKITSISQRVLKKLMVSLSILS